MQKLKSLSEYLNDLQELEQWLNDRRPQYLAIQDFMHIHVKFEIYPDTSSRIVIYYGFPDPNISWDLSSQVFHDFDAAFDRTVKEIYEWYHDYIDCRECGNFIGGLNMCPNCLVSGEIHASIFEEEEIKY